MDEVERSLLKEAQNKLEDNSLDYNKRTAEAHFLVKFLLDRSAPKTKPAEPVKMVRGHYKKRGVNIPEAVLEIIKDRPTSLNELVKRLDSTPQGIQCAVSELRGRGHNIPKFPGVKNPFYFIESKKTICKLHFKPHGGLMGKIITCKRCNYSWTPKVCNPKYCPKCANDWRTHYKNKHSRIDYEEAKAKQFAMTPSPIPAQDE